ncbi:GtrA family protein [Microbacterium ulmi]|uniref:GtrA family protein n=1 Tax=Microbacterium ulmi TaxID=179095 RepID=A0A7Y2PZH3_9MICO|nr:putative flippase GtrA [Microbacterium ulmi]NNH03293.1 GtrA family protein [Microbacterium ulmi]
MRAGFVTRHLRRGSQFLVIGLVGFVVDAVLYNALVFWGGEGPLFEYPLVAKAISLLTSLAVSYVGNKLWTYRDRPAPLSTAEVGRFIAANAVAVVLHMGCLWFSRTILGLDDIASDNLWGTVIGQAVATAFRYVVYTKWVFVARPEPLHPDPPHDGASLE